MVTARHDIRTALIELIQRFARDSLAACGVLTVDDNEVDTLFTLKFRRVLSEGTAPCTTDDISYH